MDPITITTRIEDYLEIVLEIEMEGGIPSVTELASRLGVKKATVVVAVRKMVDLGLLSHQRYGKIELTRQGRCKGLETYRRHQHLSFLFSELLGLDEDVAQEMACASEHVLNEEAEKKLSAFVDFCSLSRMEGRPWMDEMNSFMASPETLTMPLSLMTIGSTAKVVRLTGPAPLRQRLKENGILGGITVRRIDDGRDDYIEIDIDGEALKLGALEAMSIWVIPLKSRREV